MKLDVVMATMNSASRVNERFFRHVLSAIFREIPVNRLIVVDDDSRDSTLKILKEFEDVKIVNGLGSLGKAREIGIRNVETPWFYFIDDDNVIPRKFHEKMLKHVNDKVGMVHAVPFNPSQTWYAKHEMILSRMYSYFRRVEGATRRGYTGATLMRLEAVRDMTVPPISRMEDYRIKKYLEENGWEVKTALDVSVVHYSKISDKAHYFDGYYMCEFGFVSLPRMILAWLFNYPKSLLTTMISRDLGIAKNIPKIFYLRLRGYVDAYKSGKSKQKAL